MSTQTRLITAVDLFCGAGGASEALLNACKKRGYHLKLIGINHWPLAIETHSKNHSYAEHLCSDINEVNPLKIVPSGKLDVLLAGVECIFFSTARGGKPINDQRRSTGWKVLEWAERIHIRTIIIENVPEFVRWGPLYLSGPKKGKPIKKFEGQIFLAFVNGLRALGYTVDYKVLCAANYGDPTTRERFFLVATRGNHRPVWPEHSHSREGGKDIFGHRTKKWVPARKIIDWEDRGVSIFNRELYGKKPLSPNTMRRIFAGLERFCGIPFVLPPEGIGRGNAPRSVDQTLQTVVASRGGGSLIQPFLVGAGGPTGSAKPRSADEPMNTVLADNRIGVAQPFLVKLYSTTPDGLKRNLAGVDEPLPSVLGSGHLGLAQSFILNVRGGNDGYLRGAGTDDPLQTITADPAMFLVAVQHMGGANRDNRVHDGDAPVPTLTTKSDFGVAFVIPQQSGGAPRSTDEPMPTVSGAGAIGLASFITPNFGERDGQKPRTHSVDEPMVSATSRGAGNLIQPFLVAYHGGDNGDQRSESVDEPMGTADTSNRRAVVQPYLIQYNGTGGEESLDEPLNTLTGKPRHALVDPRRIAFPYPEGYKLLFVPGIGLVDVLYRMLRPKECARAHSFKDRYIWLGTQDEQMKMIGNSWPTRKGEAVIGAQLDAMFKRKRRS